MTEKWELVTITIWDDVSHIDYYSPVTWRTHWSVREYLEEYYPNLQIPDKNDKSKKKVIHAYLVEALLNDGFEPFSVATENRTEFSSNVILSFRRKIIL